jgi:hypothetical protein
MSVVLLLLFLLHINMMITAAAAIPAINGMIMKRIGGSEGRTITGNSVLSILPAVSLVLHLTVVSPTLKMEPDGGSH